MLDFNFSNTAYLTFCLYTLQCMEATHCQDIRSKLTLINVIVLVHLWASMSKLAHKGPTGI